MSDIYKRENTIEYIGGFPGVDVARDLLKVDIQASNAPPLEVDMVDRSNRDVGNVVVTDLPRVDTDIAAALASNGNDILRVEQQTPVGIEDTAGTAVDPATDTTLTNTLSREIATWSAGALSVDSNTPLDVSAAEVDVDLATQTLAQLVADLELEDAGATGTFGNIHRRGDALQTSLENDQVGLALDATLTNTLNRNIAQVDAAGVVELLNEPAAGDRRYKVDLEANNSGTFAVEQQTPVAVTANAAGGVAVEQQTPVGVEDSAGANIDPLARQDTAPVTGSTTVNATNVTLALGDYRKDVDWFVDTSGAAKFTVEVRVAGGTWRQLDTVDYASATSTFEQYSTAFAEMRARVDTALNTLEGSSKGV